MSEVAAAAPAPATESLLSAIAPPRNTCPACSQPFMPNLLRDTLLPCCGAMVCSACRGTAGGKPCPLECGHAGNVPAGSKDTIDLIKKHVDAGEAWAQYLLGTYLQMGRVVVKNEAGGLKLLQKAADQGHTAAQASVARSILQGEGVKKNVKKGLAALHKLAEASNPDALFVLCTAYSVGMPGVRVDKKKGEQLLRRAVAAGHAAAYMSVGERLWEGTAGEAQDRLRALRIFREVAVAGHPGAQFMVAHAVMHGMPGTEGDTPQHAFDLAQNAARAGFPPAQELMRNMTQYIQSVQARGSTPGRDKCAQCNKVPEGGAAALKICSGCKMIWYCSRECQVASWKGGHKVVCPKIRKFGDNFKEMLTGIPKQQPAAPAAATDEGGQ